MIISIIIKLTRSATFLILFISAVTTKIFAASNDNFVREYPGGDYGLNIGGGYDLEPAGDYQPPTPYRKDYRDTKYGPSLGRGFQVFPKTLDYGKPAPKKTEEEIARDKELKGYIFHEATTSPRGSNLWGVSGLWDGRSPRKKWRPEDRYTEAQQEEEEEAPKDRKKVFWYEPKLEAK